MHSVYMTHNPCVYNPSLHVSTQSVQNPASMGGDPVRDGGLQQKGQVYTALWNKPEQAGPCHHQYCGPCQRRQDSAELTGEPGKGQPWVRISTWEFV